MAIANATIAGHRCTDAVVSIPSWGRWFAEVSVDGEVELSGKVTLQIADLALEGAVLSGGPGKGRSFFRVVAGAGGWAKTLPPKHYTDDGGVKAVAVLGDAAREAGEQLDTTEIARTVTVGPAFTRYEGMASGVLELVSPRNWYVDERGVTRIGRRGRATLSTSATHGPVDLARRTVTIAADAIATILPGIVVDGLEAVDVEHALSETGELRSTIWAARGAGRDRRLSTIATLLEQLDPGRRFRGVWEYRVVTLEGARANLQPVRVSTGMPDLRRVPVRPGLAGGDPTLALGSRVLVAFADGDPSRHAIIAGEETSGAGFAPSALDFRAGGQVGGEHVATVEGTSLLIYNTLVALMSAAGGGPLLAAVLQPLLGAAIKTALTAQSAPAPPGAVAQAVAAVAQIPTFATGTTLATTSAFFRDTINAATKTPNESGLFPSLGAAKVTVG